MTLFPHSISDQRPQSVGNSGFPSAAWFSDIAFLKVTETTLRELGVAVSPHLFRDCAVYTVATVAGDRMGIASALLQHTDEQITEKHYNKGASLNAVRRYQHILDQLTDD